MTAVTASMLAGLGLVVTLILNVFVLDKFAAYGEVPIPGAGRVHLPAGEVTVSLHTRVISSPTGGGLPVPDLKLAIQSPAGSAAPEVVESIGSTTTINNDAHRRIWLMAVAVAGDYQITTDGQVGGFITPRLAFGHRSGYGSLPWVFAAVLCLGLLGLLLVRWCSRRSRRVPLPTSAAALDESSISTDEAIRLEQLKTLTALRDSGALTESEFAAEKRRALGGS